MSDRFRFRAWMVEKQEYVFDVESTWDDIEACFGDLINSDKYVVEQCIGLKDKNGNLIYEGDLIKSPNNSHPLVVYHDITGLWRCKENRPNGIWELPLYDMVRNYTVEIIGNIHETKGGNNE